jgi:hypothetical protein
MAIDQFENLPGILADLQDGGLTISETTTGPRVLVLGTSNKGPSDRKVRVARNQESEALFGSEGSLIRGMYEARSGGATDTFLYRINTLSAILYGVGTDNQITNPTSLETLLKDGSAADLYFVRYVSPSSLGPNATIGHLKIRNALGQLVYDNNPGGLPIDTGEVIVAGKFTGGLDIGVLLDPEDFVSFRDIAADRTQVTGEVLATLYTGVAYNAEPLANDYAVPGTLKIYIDGVEIADTSVTLNTVPLPSEVSISAGEAFTAGVVTADYQYDAESLYSLRDGKDGATSSKMELYEALDLAYQNLESDELDQVIPMEAFLDDMNVVDGDIIVHSTSELFPVGQRYPIPGSDGDGLGKLYKEEFEGSMYYFWDTDLDGTAEIFPSVGLASATTKIDGSALAASDFKEVNFAYQLADFCFRITLNDNFCLGTIGTSMPASNSIKDVSLWVGKDPTLDATTGAVIADGSGLLGNKFMAGTVTRNAGFYATFSGNLPTGNFDTNSDIIKDFGGHKVDLGKYLSITAAPLVFFNDFDQTGFGYQANAAAYYAGFVSQLSAKSAPTNKTIAGVRAPFRLFKTKLNSLAGAKYVVTKQKEGLVKIADAPTAARPDSDYQRLTTVRIVAGALDIVRFVGDPYIGEPNTQLRRAALEESIRKELADYQKAGFVQRFDVKVLATPTQVIQGDQTVELEIVPAFELRKITVITSLAKQ